MRRLLLVGTILLALPAHAAHAAAPVVTVQAAPALGPAPLTTTLTATGAASSYRWELPGDTTATGPSVTTVFPAGRHAVTLVATSASGEQTIAAVTVTAMTISLAAPRVATYATRIRLRGRVVPALTGSRLVVERDGRHVTTGVVRADGSFRIGVRPRAPGSYTVRFANVAAKAVPVAVRPRVRLETHGAAVIGGRLEAVASMQPASAGALALQVYRRGRLVAARSAGGSVRIRLDTRRAASYRLLATTRPAKGFTDSRAILDAAVRPPSLGLGSLGPGVLDLERRLSELAYALQRVDTRYGWDTYEAVLAFQKLHGLARTGRVDAAFWHALARAQRPAARYDGDHIEVDKGRQVLMLVRGGRVVLVAHISTGATGNTPVGRWRVYRKVDGWDWVLWYPMYFLRGFAIHGYPEVPAYPASHGCVRVPMWLAPRLFATNRYGTTIYVY